MIVTALLLLPVLAILLWLYWYLLPARQWLFCDSVILLILLASAAAFVGWIDRMDFDGESPLWPYIISATGAYGILTLGLGAALAWRRYRMKS
jgi:hypothetical protein